MKPATEPNSDAVVARIAGQFPPITTLPVNWSSMGEKDRKKWVDQAICNRWNSLKPLFPSATDKSARRTLRAKLVKMALERIATEEADQTPATNALIVAQDATQSNTVGRPIAQAPGTLNEAAPQFGQFVNVVNANFHSIEQHLVNFTSELAGIKESARTTAESLNAATEARLVDYREQATTNHSLKQSISALQKQMEQLQKQDRTSQPNHTPTKSSSVKTTKHAAKLETPDEHVKEEDVEKVLRKVVRAGNKRKRDGDSDD